MNESTNYDYNHWRKMRIEKKIQLTGDLSDYVGCSYNHISRWEHQPDVHPMKEDKIERYITFINAFPSSPPVIEVAKVEEIEVNRVDWSEFDEFVQNNTEYISLKELSIKFGILLESIRYRLIKFGIYDNFKYKNRNNFSAQVDIKDVQYRFIVIDKVRELRKKIKVSQKELAENLGVTAQQISFWEVNGGRFPIKYEDALKTKLSLTDEDYKYGQ